MKNFVKWFGIISMTLVVAFSFAALSLTSCDDGGGGPRTVMYSGKASSGDSYSLLIIENPKNPNRAVLNDPLSGDNFEFTWTDSANKTKKSAGQVTAVSGNEFTMLPAKAATNQTTFTTTVSDEGLTAMSGTFTWTDGTTSTGSGTLTPSGGPGKTPGTGGGGGGGSVKWTEVTNTALGTGSYDQINAIVYGEDKFVAVDVHGKMAYSSNGINWTAVADSTTTKVLSAIAYGGGKFVAVGRFDNTAYSSDGVTWTAVSPYSGIFPSTINAIAYGNGKFVAGGSGGETAYSTDGVNWIKGPDKILGTYYYSSSNPQRICSIETIAYANNKFVAGGDGGKMAYSTDGVTWTPVTTTAFDFPNEFKADIRAIAWGGNKFVAGCYQGRMAYSADGITWTGISLLDNTGSDKSISIQAIAYGGGKFVVGGYGVQGKGARVEYSSDGVNWTTTGDIAWGDSDNLGLITAIAYGNGKFIAVGTRNLSSGGCKMAYSSGN
jgi:hypothetical protein